MPTFRGTVALSLLALLWARAPWAATYPLPAEGDIVGALQSMRASSADTLVDVARRHGLGYDEVVRANPAIDKWLPQDGDQVVLPTHYVLPDAPRDGIVINLAELRMYYYPPAPAGVERTVMTFPVGIGRDGWATPVGVTRVVERVRDPAWFPPASIRREHAAQGRPLPRVVPPGPDNPLGALAMRLGFRSRLIHGTNKPFGIGMRVTHGCIRLYPEHIEQLFDRVPVGTRVRIVDQAYKAGWSDGVLYLESHPRVDEGAPAKGLSDATRGIVAALRRSPGYSIDWDTATRTFLDARGLPLPIAAQLGESASIEATFTDIGSPVPVN